MAGEGPSYLLQLPLLVLPEGKVQQLVVPGHLQVHVLMGKSRISWAEGCPPAFGHSEPLSRGQKWGVYGSSGHSHYMGQRASQHPGHLGSEQGGQETGTQAQEEPREVKGKRAKKGEGGLVWEEACSCVQMENVYMPSDGTPTRGEGPSSRPWHLPQGQVQLELRCWLIAL